MKLAASTSTTTATSSNTTGCTSATMFLSTTTSSNSTELLPSKPVAPFHLEDEPEELLEDYIELQQKEDKNKTSSSGGKKSKQQKIRMPQRKGGMQLWQFLYALLEDPEKRYGDMIEWTDNRIELEFRLLDPEAIAIWWGNIKHRANMTYERLSRSLRYYYDRGILKKMGGERYLYRFCVDPEEMYKHIGNSDSRPVLKPMPVQVSKWMYSRMMMPHGVFFPTATTSLAPPEYSTAILHQQQQQQTLPPPPPYPGFPADHQFYLPNPLGYDYLTHISQETDTTTVPYTNMSAPHHYEPFQEMPSPAAESIFIATSSTTGLCSYNSTSSLGPSSPLGQSTLSSSDITITANSCTVATSHHQINHFHGTQQLSHHPTTNNYPMTIQQPIDLQNADPSCNLYFDGGATSPLYSGSTCSGGDCEMALDEILPILASMEQSDELFSSSHNSSLSNSPTIPISPPYAPSSSHISPHSSYGLIPPSSSHYSTTTSTYH